MRQLDTTVAAAMNDRYPRVDASARGWMELEFIVYATDMTEAMDKAVQMASAVSGSTPLSCKVTSNSGIFSEIGGRALRIGRHASPGERDVRPGNAV
jgi:hypothetical protein